MNTANKISIAIILVVMVGAIITAAVMGNSAWYYQPTEMQTLTLTKNTIIKIGGQVQPTSLQVRKKRSSIRFTLLDKKHQIKVRYTGNKPQFLEEGKSLGS